MCAYGTFRFATLRGARSIGLGDVTGSLTPGKQADVLVVRPKDLNNMPLNDPIGTLARGCNARNIHAAFIAGQVRKWVGTVLDVDLATLREGVRASRGRYEEERDGGKRAYTGRNKT